ncbi:MAG: hypothetical protein ABI461_04070, partial [Polyangiaceae bacterium]
MAATNLKLRENEPLSLEAIRNRLMHSARNFDRTLEHDSRNSDLDWPELAQVLPDGGFPSGVIELSSPHAMGGSAAVAFAAIRSVQKRTSAANLLPSVVPAAWIDTDCTLHAPGAHRAGVDLARLFVVRPPRSELGRIAV